MEKEIVLISGGTGAIGLTFARALVESGRQVVILGRGRTKPVSDAVDQVEFERGKKNLLYGYHCDVSDEKSMSETLHQYFFNGFLSPFVGCMGLRRFQGGCS